jgi:hypothetical protein
VQFLLRKINAAKWLANLECSLPSYSADAITGCTRTHGNTLSIWETDSINLSDEHNAKIITALAASMTSPQSIDLLFIQPDDLLSKDMEIIKSDGESIVESINNHHYDVVGVNYEKLGLFAKLIVDKCSENQANGPVKKLSKKQVVDIVANSIKNGFCSLDSFDVDTTWHKELTKALSKI